MTETVGTVAVEVVADLSKFETGLARARAQATDLDKNAKQAMDGVVKSTQGATNAVAGFTQGMQRTAQTANQTRQATQSLVQTTQQLTQSMLGSNVVAVSLGAAIGGVLQATITQTVRALGDAVTQFTRLQNELAVIQSVGGGAATVLAQIQAVSAGSASTLAELTQRFGGLAQQVAGTRVTMEEALAIFVEHERAMQRLQQQTVGAAFSGAMTAMGGLLAGLAEFSGVSGALAAVLNSIRSGFQSIARLLPGQVLVPVQQLNAELLTNIERQREITQALEAGNVPWLRRLLLQQELNRLTRDERGLRDDIARAQTRLVSPEVSIRQLDILRQSNAELAMEVSLMRLSSVQRDIRMRQFQMDQQIRLLAGAGALRLAVEQELQRNLALLQQQALAQQFQGLRDSLLTAEGLEMQSFQRRTEMIQGFLNSRLISQQEHDALMEQEFFRSNVAMQQIQQQAAMHLINAQMQAGQALVGVLQQLQGKSKAAAIAAIAVNTALQVAQAIQNTAAASTRALAELGPIAGPPAAAAISAWGAAQVGLIIAAGALQGANALSQGGPSIPGAGGQGGGLPSPIQDDENRKAPSLISIEGVDPAAIFTGQVLIDLVSQINNAVENGNVLISTRNIAGAKTTAGAGTR